MSERIIIGEAGDGRAGLPISAPVVEPSRLVLSLPVRWRKKGECFVLEFWRPGVAAWQEVPCVIEEGNEQTL